MKRFTLAMAIAAMALGSGAQAVVLPAGTTPISGTTVAANPQLAGTVLEDDDVAFSFAAGTVTGHVQSRVVRSSVDGTLDFYWRVFNDDNSATSLTSFRLVNFFTSVYNGDYRTDGLGDVGPDNVLNFGGGALNFRFDETPVGPGQSSYFMFLDTNAVNYNRSALYDLTSLRDGEISTLFSTFAPTAFVPEPGTYALMLGGLGITALVRRRRKPGA